MIPEYPPKPRYGDGWKNLQAAIEEAYIYELLKKMGESEDA